MVTHTILAKVEPGRYRKRSKASLLAPTRSPSLGRARPR